MGGCAACGVSIGRPAGLSGAFRRAESDRWLGCPTPRGSGRVPRSVPTVRRSAGCDGRRRRSRRSVSIVCPRSHDPATGREPSRPAVRAPRWHRGSVRRRADRRPPQRGRGLRALRVVGTRPGPLGAGARRGPLSSDPGRSRGRSAGNEGRPRVSRCERGSVGGGGVGRDCAGEMFAAFAAGKSLRIRQIGIKSGYDIIPLTGIGPALRKLNQFCTRR